MNHDESVVVRTYAGEALASIAAARLESEGIETIIQKDDAGGAYPPLQMTRGVRLLVKPEDLPRAEEVLAEIEAEDSGELEQPEPVGDRRTNKFNFIALIAVFLLGLTIGYFLEPALIERSSYTGQVTADRNERGKPGSFGHYVDGKIARVEEDRNYDGKLDAWVKYEGGRTRSATFDNNFDGKPDKWLTHKDKFNYIVKIDTDFDGKPDVTMFFVHGIDTKSGLASQRFRDYRAKAAFHARHTQGRACRHRSGRSIRSEDHLR